MKDKTLIIGTDNNGNSVNISQLEELLRDTEQNKSIIADVVYNRLYLRYIKPFEYDDKNYISEYKSGFSIMANSCLLIESFISFAAIEFLSTKNKSEKAFGYFFSNYKNFKVFATGGLSINNYTNHKISITNRGIPRSFYINVRCGLLHSGETRNSWRIRRDGNSILTIKDNAKIINANLFLKELHQVIKNHFAGLKSLNVESDQWQTLLKRLYLIIDHS